MSHWLMKSEPDCYSIDDLAREGVSMWEGCRNYTVRNFLRDQMKLGDRAFFYHSSVQPAGIAGVMEVASAPYPDPTQFDPNSEYFDATSLVGSPRWFALDVKFVAKLDPLISLDELRAAPGLEEMAVLRRGQRLSVMPLTAQEWNLVMGLRGLRS